MTNMRTNQTNYEIRGQRIRESVLGRGVEMNIKLIRNAMFVTAVIVVISVMGKASAYDGFSRSMRNAGDVTWMAEADR